MAKPLLLPLAILFVALAKTSAAPLPEKYLRILTGANEVTLISLSPYHIDLRPGEPAIAEWKNLGGVVFTDPAKVKKVITVLTAALKAGDDSSLCFQPRHALRVKHQGRDYDFVICFECDEVAVYLGPRYLAAGSLRGSPHPYNWLLRAAKIPLPKPFWIIKQELQKEGRL